MTLQQLRYMVCIAEQASLGEASSILHISQPALSVAIRDMEDELGFQLFSRTPKGMTLTLNGLEFLSYARQVLQQVDLLERKFKQDSGKFQRFSISTQHYTFIVDAFVQFAKRHAGQPYIFNYRETTTSGIVEDVAKEYSELGIIFCSTYNESIMRNIFMEHGIIYHDLIWQKPHVFLSASHPLRNRKSVSVEDLEPYPCVTFDRGRGAPLHYAEEVLSDRSLRQNIRVTDRDSCVNFLLHLNAYNIGTGIFTSVGSKKIIAIPLEVKEYIRVVSIRKKERVISPLADIFMQDLQKILEKLPLPVIPAPFLP